MSNTEKKPAVLRYYAIAGNGKPRIVKAPSAYAAIMHAYEPVIAVATTDEVLHFKEAGGVIETAGEGA